MFSSETFGTQTGSSVATSQIAILHLHLIGEVRACSADEVPIPLLGRRAHALLAILALSPQPVSRLFLMQVLWSRRGEDQQRASLRQEVYRLQSALAAVGLDVLQIGREHLDLRRAGVWTDIEEISRATVNDPASLAMLTEPLLEGLDAIDPAFKDWLIEERGKLISHARYVAKEVLARQVKPDGAVVAARQLLAFDPVHEGAWLAKIRAYSELGDRSLAIQTYKKCRAALAEKLGTVPCEEMERLVEAIRADNPPRV